MDEAEAVKFYRKAAEQGHSSAQERLGDCYYSGMGCREDKAEAVKWYVKGADQEDRDAQSKLGDCFFHGNGVKEDKAEAINWYRKAAEQGHTGAQFILAQLYEHGRELAVDDVEAAKWYRRAAEGGHAEARYILGQFNELGRGAAVDKVEAIKWYGRAATQGHAEARLWEERNPHLLPEASKERPWENGLGMKFVPVQGTKVLFSVWLARVQDFEVFVKETGHITTSEVTSLQEEEWGEYGHSWKSPGFSQGPTHPVCGVSWEDAKAFCGWLSRKEAWGYRLPTDEEWSWAVGIGHMEIGETPREREKSLEGKVVYPWGTTWPPPKGVSAQSAANPSTIKTARLALIQSTGRRVPDGGESLWARKF